MILINKEQQYNYALFTSKYTRHYNGIENNIRDMKAYQPCEIVIHLTHDILLLDNEFARTHTSVSSCKIFARYLLTGHVAAHRTLMRFFPVCASMCRLIICNKANLSLDKLHKFFISMNRHVAIQVWHQRKPFAANRTLVTFFSCMGQHVCPQL